MQLSPIYEQRLAEAKGCLLRNELYSKTLIISMFHDLTGKVRMKERVYHWTGIPVSVGIGKTKTLAKIANEYAKMQEGICVLHDTDQTTALLQATPIGDVWGIGRQIAERLGAMRVNTAEKFRALD